MSHLRRCPISIVLHKHNTSGDPEKRGLAERAELRVENLELRIGEKTEKN